MLKEDPPFHISKTIIEMIDLPHIKGNIASFTLISEEEGWKGATLFISYDDKDYKAYRKCKYTIYLRICNRIYR
ncbi:hypothetical protein [Wolbachia endosymbiont of Diaphorina citri]|uniref:hypothetical protein n=1 Tax=Wolbachia endosymbiont of Diaphorina citri TaxID=116598 RepID=UPI00223EB112|nr:hypothetical protein [Wolbachia endosymbiont of Diaphorina citri]